MERRFGFVFFYSEAILGSVLASSMVIDDNRGSHAIRRHFVLHCEVTLPIIFEFSQM